MNPPLRPLLSCLLFALACTLLPGCQGSSQYMTPLPSDTPLAPPPGQALVVFIRPSGVPGLSSVTIMDDKATFIGEPLPSSHFAVPLDPGTYNFISWSVNTEVLKAELAAGKVYYVEVAATIGTVVKLLAVKTNKNNWNSLETWLGATKQIKPLTQLGQAYLDKRKTQVLGKIKNALQEFDTMPQGDRDDRTLTAADGSPPKTASSPGGLRSLGGALGGKGSGE